MRTLRLHSLIIAVALATACGDGTGPEDARPHLIITPTVDTIHALGDTVRLRAVLVLPGNRADSGVTVRWVSTDRSVVLVTSRGGLVTAVGPGPAEIIARRADGLSALLPIVVAQRPTTLTVIPNTAASLLEGDTLLLKATVADANGFAISDARVAWSSSDASVATVDSAGVVTGRRRGEARIIASAQPVATSVDLTVEDGFLVTAINNSSWGLGHTCAVDRDGVGYCWTSDSLLAHPVPGTLRFRSLTAGDQHFCGIAVDDRGYCWGANHQGQLGMGVVGGAFTEPQPVTGGHLFRVLRATAHDYVCGVTTNDQVLCWGHNDVGQLGRGFESQHEPTIAPPIPSFSARMVDGDGLHACAVTTDNRLYCWGWPVAHTVEVTSDSALLADVDLEYAVVTTGLNFSCALTVSGAAYCWGALGRGARGRLLGTGDTAAVPAPKPVFGGHVFSSISAGNGHTCALTAEGMAYCWGRNESMELGDGTTIDRWEPTPVATDLRFSAITAGYYYTCGIALSGAVYCWGGGTDGSGRSVVLMERPTRVLRAPSAGPALALSEAGMPVDHPPHPGSSR